MKPPNEKLIETLFTHYALFFLGPGAFSVYTPTTIDEYKEGYDAALMGVSGFDELFLQFKTYAPLVYEDCRIKTTEHQHDRLRGYPSKTAYYVAHTFEDLHQVQEAQHTVVNPADFLRRYVAIEIEGLEDDVTRFYYSVSVPEYLPLEVRFHRRSDVGTRRATHPVKAGDGWILGDELLRRFMEGTVGARVHLQSAPQNDGLLWSAGEPKRPLPLWEMNAHLAGQLAGKETGTKWGSAYRKAFLPLLAD